MIISLLRHGRTEWNDAGRMQGRADLPLSEDGHAQVESWRAAIERDPPAEWLSSPLRRALITAEILSGRAPRIEKALIEMDWGRWEGCTLDELRERFGAEFHRNEDAGLDFRPPGGESPRDVQRRVRRWLEDIRDDTSGPIVAVTHKGVLRAILAMATGWDMLSKPPVKLRDNALHRFALDAAGAISLLEANVPLLTSTAAELGARRDTRP